jgi:hypothetical protein
MNFLTLPRLPNSIGIWGAGEAVSLLSECRWLQSCRILYWGDIDVRGFEILSRLRTNFPRTQSLLMGEATLRRFQRLALPGNGSKPGTPDNLAPEEQGAFNTVLSENLKLEQEKLPPDAAKQALQAAIQNSHKDTDRASEAILVEGYRKMTPVQKIQRVRSLTFAVQELALLDIRRRYPAADRFEQALRLASRWIPPELMRRAFGWDSDKAGY